MFVLIWCALSMLFSSIGRCNCQSNLCNLNMIYDTSVSINFNETVSVSLWYCHIYAQSHLEKGTLKNKKSSNRHPRKPCKNIETSPSHMETSSKNSLSFCQEDEPASDEFCSIIRLSIQFILDEFISSINSAVQVTFNCITGRCFWLFTIRIQRIPVTANP